MSYSYKTSLHFSYNHALRVRKWAGGDQAAGHALRIKKDFGHSHALRIKRDGLVRPSTSALGHALRIKKDLMAGHSHALRIKKDFGHNHALRIKKFLLDDLLNGAGDDDDDDDELAQEEYEGVYDLEPYIKRDMSRSHLLRTI